MGRLILALVCCVAAVEGQESRSLLTNGLQTPNWLTLNAQARYRAEGQHGLGYVAGNNQDFLLQRLRLSMGLRPAHWLKFFGEVQDARAYGTATDPSTANYLDLRQAFADIGNESAWWDVKIGRQSMTFGTERLIGGSDWTNAARVFDGVRLGIHHGVNRVDVFATSVVNTNRNDWDHHLQGNNLHGVVGSIGSLIKGAKVEPYVLWRLSHNFAGEPGTAGAYHSYTYGLRLAGTARQVWFYEADVLAQRGKIATSNLSAWATEVQGRRQFVNIRWRPSLFGEFNFASGDARRGDGKVNTLDQLYPTNHGIYGVADQVGRRNTKNVRLGVWAQPKRWLTLRVEGVDAWLASRNDAMYVANGSVAVQAPLGGFATSHVGREVDAWAQVAVSRYYSIGAQFGRFFAGPLMNRYSTSVGRTFYATWIDFRI